MDSREKRKNFTPLNGLNRTYLFIKGEALKETNDLMEAKMTWRMMVPFSGRELAAVDPFVSLQKQMNRMFDDVLGGVPQVVTGHAPRLDVKEDDKAYHITAELPGLSEKDVEMTFDDGVLTLRGEKKIEREEKGQTWHIVERSSGSFSRQLALPCAIDAEKIEAKFDKGVLTVELPKMAEEKAKAKKIEIKG